MEILVLSCGTGGGHHAAAAAIEEELLCRGHSVTMLNPYDLLGGKLAARVDNAYISLAQRAPGGFGAIYALGRVYRKLPWRSPVYYVNAHMADAMTAYLQEHPVDAVVMTHIFPGEIMTCLRDRGVAVPKTILIATDYVCVPFTEECICDAYVIPSPELTGEYIGHGVPEERIFPLGIPVRSSFRAAVTREQAKAALGLAPDKRYILVSGGSIGAGRLEKALHILRTVTKDTDIRLIIICGNNEALYRRLEKRCGPEVRLIRQTKQMALYLRACEMFFTKPGGLSTTEAAVMEVPLALLPPIPGCENRNRAFYTQTGMGTAVTLSAKDMRRAVDLLRSPSDCERMLERQRASIPKDAAQRICDLISAEVAGQQLA